MRNLIERLEEASEPATPTLDEYLKRQFYGPKLSKDSASDRAKIFQKVDNDLEPENLTWDGERPASEVRKATKYLKKIMQDLLALDQYYRKLPSGD